MTGDRLEGRPDIPRFEALVLPHLDAAFNLARWLTRDGQEAEEIVQEAFVRTWERWDRVGAMDDPTGYLYRTAFNVQRSAYRRVVRSARRSLTRTPEPDPYGTVADREEIVRALAVMTPRERAAVILNQANQDSADITLVYFPGSYASLKERVSYEEVVEKLRLLSGGSK